MSEFIFNLNDVDEKSTDGFGLISKGDHDFIVDNCEFQFSKKSGAPMLKWTFKVVDGEFEGRLHWEYTVLNQPFGLKNLKKILIALNCGVDFATFNPKEFADEGTAINENLTITMDVKKDKNTNEDRNVSKDFKVMTTNSFMGGFEPTGLDPAGFQAIGDDDIPF